jgi:hypothetical protein
MVWLFIVLLKLKWLNKQIARNKLQNCTYNIEPNSEFLWKITFPLPPILILYRNSLYKLGRVLWNDILLKFDPITNLLNWDKWLDCKHFCFKRKNIVKYIEFHNYFVYQFEANQFSSIRSDLILSTNKGLEIGKMCDWDWKSVSLSWPPAGHALHYEIRQNHRNSESSI